MKPKDSVNEESIADQPGSRWFLDLDWFQQNNRSLFALVKGCLCPKCHKRLAAEKREVPSADLLAAVRDCCSKTPGFITGQLPVLESIFRFFLANDNQPLDLEELGRQLGEWRGGDAYSTSAEILSRLLESDRYYGFCQVPEPAEPDS